nr:putative zinc finger, CCHC-type [Tanacetum cinerariifolium]
MMKGSTIGIQEKKAKLFNEWERFTSNEGESIESYYHRFLKLMNDLKRNKHFPEKIASNLKFLNNLQPEWSRHVTTIHQTKDLHTADYTQLYDFLKYNQKEVDELKAERLTKIQDPLALMVAQNPRVQNDGKYNQIENGNLVAVRAEGNAAGHNGNQIRCYNCRGLGYFARDCTTDNTPVYDTDGSAEVHENYDDNEIFNMFTQEEQYTELLEPIPEPQQVPQNDNNVISEVTDVEQDGETVEQQSANLEETRALYESLYQNLAVEVEKVNSV